MENVLVPSISPLEKQQIAEELVDVLAQQELSRSQQVEYVKDLFDELNFKFQDHSRPMDVYYDEIVERLYVGKNISKKDIEHHMEMFDSAYTLMKLAFSEKKRQTENERYFSHLKGVMEIVLRELPGANIERIVIALLHDVLEDIPGYSYETLRTIYGEYIADGVLFLSKNDWYDYLSEQEQLAYGVADSEGRNLLKYRAKDRRNKEYFGHMESLNDDYLAAKLADRIHNLRTMDHFSDKKLRMKLAETEKYFLTPEIKEKMPEAYLLIKQEVDMLKKKLK